MKTVLVLGTGMVASPAISYLLNLDEVQVRVASLEVERAQALLQGHPRGAAHTLDVQNRPALEAAIAAPEVSVVISLLPYIYHVQVAEICLAHGKHLVTTSYVSPGMQALDAPAKAAGLTLLNEVGADPGIDHMSAMRVIRRIQGHGGEVTHFRSWCGGLPAPDAATNPLGYKFSWSPRGVLLAGRNPAHYLEEGQEITIPAGELFEHHWSVSIPGLPPLEGYPNRDSLPYAERYGIPTAKTIFRGTLRNPGWCEALNILLKLGFLELEPQSWPQNSLGEWTADLLGCAEHSPEALRRCIAARMGLASTAAALETATLETAALEALAWLGLFSAEALPVHHGGAIDMLTACMLARMGYAENERDMLIMRHEFGASYPDAGEEAITSTLLAYGIPGGDSAMARTVGLPAAIAARLLLEGTLQRSGVLIPILPEVFEPVLTELERHGIRFEETCEKQA